MKNLNVMRGRDTFCKMMKKMRNKMGIKVIVFSGESRSEVFSVYQFLDEIEAPV